MQFASMPQAVDTVLAQYYALLSRYHCLVPLNGEKVMHIVTVRAILTHIALFSCSCNMANSVDFKSKWVHKAKSQVDVNCPYVSIVTV